MKRQRPLQMIFAGMLPALFSSAASPASFAPGDLLIYRVGDGLTSPSASNTAYPVFLDEYRLDGTFVQSIALPASGANALTSTNAADVGLINRSANGLCLTLTGVSVDSGSGTTGQQRAASFMLPSGAPDTTTDASTTVVKLGTFAYLDDSVRSSVSSDCSQVWISGNYTSSSYTRGIYYIAKDGSGLAQLFGSNAVQGLSIAGTQLYGSIGGGSGTVSKVGSGLPTSGTQTPASLGTTTNKNYRSIAFLDLDGSVPGVDTLYAANNSDGKLVKYYGSATSWTAAGSVSVAKITGLMAVDIGHGAIALFFTNTNDNKLQVVVDRAGRTGSLAGTPTDLLSAPTDGTLRRGIAWAPESSPASAAPNAPTGASYSNLASNGFTANWTAPAGGAAFYVLEVSHDSFSSIDQTLFVYGVTSKQVTNLTTNGTYSFRVRAVNSAGASTDLTYSGSPAITIDTSNTLPTINGLANNTALSGVKDDAGDPLATSGLSFAVSDHEDSAGQLAVSAVSNNTAVVPNANISIVNNIGSVVLKIVPAAVGKADITVGVQDAGGLATTRTIHYAASANTAGDANTRWYTGRSDGSTAIPLSDGTTMLIGDDEAPVQDASGNALAGGNSLSAYSRSASGAPLATLIPDGMGSGLGLSDPSMQSYAGCTAAGYTGVENNNCKADGEVDIETSFAIGNRIYVAGSHSNNKNGHSRPDRWRFFALDVSGSGASTSLNLVGYYKWLREDLRTWDSGNSHGLGADYFGLVASSNGGSGQQPERATLDGFSIEGMTTNPGDTAVWIAFRAPLVAAPNQPPVNFGVADGRVDALIVPVTNFAGLLAADGGNKGSSTLGAPIRLDLGGRGIREIRKNAANQYLIIAGPPDSATGSAPHDFRLYSWDGSVDSNGLATNLYLRSASRLAAITAPYTECATEGIMAPPADVNAGGSADLISDCGDADFYGDGSAAKDLPYNEWKKFRADTVVLSSIAQTITFNTLSDRTLGSGSFTLGASGGASTSPVVFTSLTPTVCQTAGGNGSAVSLATTGTCTIRASQAGDSGYVAASPVDRSFNVTLPSGTGTSIGSGSETGGVSSGSWVFAPMGTNALQSGGFIGTTGAVKSPPSLPAGYSFPYGLFDFVLLDGTPGSQATVAINYPAALPVGVVYWKYGPTQSNANSHWYSLPEGSGPGTISISADRKTITLTLADGGLGDDDLAANSVIVDQGGPGVPATATAVPTLGEWGRIVLGFLIAMFALAVGRRTA